MEHSLSYTASKYTKYVWADVYYDFGIALSQIFWQPGCCVATARICIVVFE